MVLNEGLSSLKYRILFKPLFPYNKLEKYKQKLVELRAKRAVGRAMAPGVREFSYERSFGEFEQRYVDASLDKRTRRISAEELEKICNLKLNIS